MKPTQQKNLLYILIPSTILVILWIIFSVYNRAVTSTITSFQQTAIIPIAPTFDSTIFTTLEKRIPVVPLLTGGGILDTELASGTAQITPDSTTVTPATNAAEGVLFDE